MGLTDNQIEILGDRIAGLYQELENDVIRDIARRVKKTGTYTETAELMAKAMCDTGASPAEIRIKVMKQLHATPEYEAEVARNTLEYKKAVKRAIAETERIAKLTCDEIIANAGDMSFNYDLSMWEQSGQKLTKNSAFTRQVRRFQILTGKKLKNLTQTTGFKTPHSTIKVQDAYQHALDKALMKVTTGTFSFDRAVEDCVRELASSGLRNINYASGRSYQLDTAARMCIRTASAQLASNITMQHCDEMGTDLVEVDSHWGARPEHAVWQGKIYSRSGKNKKYPNFSICRYGEVDGLCGANCRHTFYPFFEGISTPNTWEKEPEPKGYRDKMYTYTEATQKQRQMERNIRATKREIEAVKAMNGDSKILEAKKRKQINEYHDFSNAMGIRAKDNRLRVVTGSSDLTKTKSGKEIKRVNANKGLLRISQIPASTVFEKIKRGEYSTKLSKQHYDKHIIGTVKYNEYLEQRRRKGSNPQSVLIIDFNEAQKVIESKAGTGIIKVDRNGNARSQEQITCDEVIGKIYVNGEYLDTKKAVIHYAKRSAHLVPIVGDNYD